MGLVRSRGMILTALAAAAVSASAGCAGLTGPDAESSGTSPRGLTNARAAGPSTQNPVPRDERSVSLGRTLYAKQCQSCHGPRGRGDGQAAGRLNVSVPDLTDPDVQSESDGELFTIITRGSKLMPAYRRLLSEEQRWHVVNYVRSAFGRPGSST
jgi:mono/diheme cytochrome c family protein